MNACKNEFSFDQVFYLRGAGDLFHANAFFFIYKKKKGGQQGEGGDCLPLLSSCEAASGLLHPGLRLPAQERCRALGMGPEEDH